MCGYHEVDLPFVTHKDGKVIGNLGLAEIFIEVKAKEDNDPFVDPPDGLCDPRAIAKHEFIRTGRLNSNMNYNVNQTYALHNASRTLGQNVSYASDAFARQHRIFYFSIFIIGAHARFIRWDRSGAIVSRAFNYKTQPKYLCDFLWRFGMAASHRRGYDPTVMRATREEEEIFKRAIKSQVAVQLRIDPKVEKKKFSEEVKLHYARDRVTKVEVYDEKRKAVDHYLVSRPVKSPNSVAGRCTRGFWSVRLEDNEKGDVTFMKDTWRIDVDRMQPEGVAYAKLNEKKVPNVGTMLCGSDVFELAPNNSSGKSFYLAIHI